jgi:hypothetical protein
MNRNIICVAALFALGLSGCSTPKTQIKNALIDAGLSEKMSGCMAERMYDKLSLLQLNKLRGLKKLKETDGKKLSINEFMKRTKSLQDPEIMGVITSSSVICAFK